MQLSKLEKKLQDLPSKTQTLKNGLELDYLGEGGIVEFVSTDRIQWFRDILPMFTATWSIILIHVFYYLTGNISIIVFLV